MWHLLKMGEIAELAKIFSHAKHVHRFKYDREENELRVCGLTIVAAERKPLEEGDVAYYVQIREFDRVVSLPREFTHSEEVYEGCASCGHDIIHLENYHAIIVVYENQISFKLPDELIFQRPESTKNKFPKNH